MTRWPVYDDEQIEAVAAALRSGKVNAWTGPYVADFERDYAAYLGGPRAIALANGTLALDLALKVIDLQPGDEVIVTPRSFVASASCVPMAGGIPVFADVDLDSQNLTATTIAPHITAKTKAVILVHLAGWPCDMEPIMALAKKHGFWVIEDCAQAHGAFYRNKPVGAWGHMAAFSFCQDKIITTGGEGGLLAVQDEQLWSKAWSYKDHGKSYEAVFKRQHAPGFRWLHESFGTNWRMTALQAVLGSAQLRKLPEWNRSRKAKAEIYAKACTAIPGLRVPMPGDGIAHGWYRFYAFVRPEKLRPDWNRDRILAELTHRGVTCFSGSCPEIYLEKSFVDAGYGPAQRLPNALALGNTSIAFLVDPSEDEGVLQNNVASLASVMQQACAL